MEQRIIGAKGGRQGRARGGRDGPRADAPRVQNVRIDAGSDGQRLDNFLAKLLKGVPQDARLPRHPLGRGARQQGPRRRRHPRWRSATRCACRRCGSPIAASGRDAPAREFPVVHEDEHAALHRQAGRRRRARRQRRELRRDRAAAPGAAGRSSSSSCTGSTRKPRACCCSPRSGRRWSRCRTTCARAARARHRQDLCGAGRRRLARVSSRSSTSPCASTSPRDGEPARARRRRRRRATAGARSRWCGWRSRFGDFSLLDVTHQDRPHAPDPRPPRATPAMPSPAIRKYGDFALNRALARGTLVAPLRFERMFLHARRLRFRHPATGDAARARSAAAGGVPRAAGRARAAVPPEPRGRGAVASYAGPRPRPPALPASVGFQCRFLSCPPAVVGVRPRPAPLEGTYHENQASRYRRGRRPRASARSPAARRPPSTPSAKQRRPDGQAPGDRRQRRRRAVASLCPGSVVARDGRQGARRARLPVDRLGRLRRRRLVRPGRAAHARPESSATTAPPPARSACSPAPNRRRSTSSS